MKLYHGTNINFNRIDLSKCMPNKDFGQGFYLTDIQQQAWDMADRRCRIERSGEPVLITFEVPDDLFAIAALKVKRFERPDIEWAQFVFNNRNNSTDNYLHDYDIVYGPIANDGVALQLGLFKDGLISLETLAKALEYRKLNNQYCFCTEAALQYLRRI